MRLLPLLIKPFYAEVGWCGRKSAERDEHGIFRSWKLTIPLAIVVGW